MAATDLVDVVDHDDRVVNSVTRAEMRARNLRHRAVGILVLSSAGRLLVHRRSDDKDVWPGRWDIAAGGVVDAGETYEVAARRELAEELGIEGASLRGIGAGRFDDDHVRLFAQFFSCTWDGPIEFTDGEVAEARWVLWPELAGLLAEHPFCPDSVTLGLPFAMEALRVREGTR